MKWMVHLHPGLAAILTGAGEPVLLQGPVVAPGSGSAPGDTPENAPEHRIDPACFLAALFHIDQNGLYEAPLTRLWPQDVLPSAPALPPGIGFYLLDDPDHLSPPLLLAVALHALDPDITILAVLCGDRLPAPAKNAATFAARPDEIVAFFALVRKRFEDLEDWPEGKESFQNKVLPQVIPALNMAAEQVQDRWLRRAQIAANYAAALHATRQDVAALFNITDARVQRIEKRFSYILERLRRNLQDHGATCRIQIIFSADGKTLSGDDLDDVR